MSVGAVATALIFGTGESRRRKRESKSIAREICSAAARREAYLEVATRLLTDPITFVQQMDAIDAIRVNSRVVWDSLNLLLDRENLSDGVIAVGVAGREISRGLMEALTFIRNGTDPADVARARIELHHLGRFATMMEARAAGVRKTFKLHPSSAAALIKSKYGEMMDACATSLASGEPPPPFQPF